MALSDYRDKLPKLFPSPSSPSQENGGDTGAGTAPSSENTLETEQHTTKGFVDIVEYHKPGFAGREVSIHETKRFIPQQNRTKKKEKDYNYEDHAVVLRRTWMEQNGMSFLVRIELEIHSKPLCAALRRIAAKCYASTDLKSYPIKLRSPFVELFFYRNDIRELADTAADLDLRRDAKALDEFVHRPDGVMASIIQDHERYSKNGQVVNDILWTIFPPNSLAVFDNGVVKECWIVRDVESITPSRLSLPLWQVTGLRLDYDGSSPGLVQQRFSTPLIGMRLQKISSLSLMPVHNHPDWKELRETLLARSRKLTEALGDDFSSFRCQIYSGPSWRSPSETYRDREDPMLSATEVDERFIMDFKAIFPERSVRVTLVDLEGTDDSRSRQKTSRPMPRGVVSNRELDPADTKRRRRYLHSSLNDDTDSSSNIETSMRQEDEVNPMAFPTQETSHVVIAENEQPESGKSDLKTINGVAEAAAKKFLIDKSDVALLFPALVPVFGLRSKSWTWALADKLQDVKWNMAAFQSLQLDQVTKNLVEALVKGHKHKKIVFDDIIEGKGQGLIFLLHGKPGLGKTLTAESVADYLERPLYSISGGELGTQVYSVEERLKTIFDKAKRWNAVTLLDEADVLLCKRSSIEMDRNAIVAVFLRMLEYFQGVLFLTTNRKEDFDDAFKSRIHVTITYPKLSSASRSQIWENLINKNKSVEIDESWTKEVYTALGKLNLNGRRIKNILRTAVAYANSEEKPLGARHVLAMLRTELQGNDDEDFDDEDDKLKDGVHDSLKELHTILDIPF